MAYFTTNESTVEEFVLNYIGDREVSFMTILDNHMVRRFGNTTLYDSNRDIEASVLKSMLTDMVINGILEQNEFRFYRRVKNV